MEAEPQEPSRYTEHDCEKRMAAAMVALAVRDYHLGDEYNRLSAKRWIKSEVDYEYSFNRVCEWLGYDPEVFRDDIFNNGRRMTASMMSSRRGAKLQ